MRRKTNPRRVPATQADVEAARTESVGKSMLIFLWALVDKGFISPEQLWAVSDAVSYVAESINQGYLRLDDIEQTLKKEYGVEVKMK